jgi:serine phosphatase RsbU (regulator of sigma subunit)/tetratricopeptide (TPR) repeat protein
LFPDKQILDLCFELLKSTILSGAEHSVGNQDLTERGSIDELNSEAWTLHRNNPAKAIQLSEEALKRATTIAYKKGIALAQKTLGSSYVWVSRNEDALAASMAALSLFKELEDKQNEAQVYYNMGTNFSYLADYDNALKNYHLCYNVNERLNNQVGMADGLNGLGTIYYSIGENPKALEVLERSRRICEKENEKQVLVKVLDGLGETYFNLGKFPQALENYFLCLDLIRETSWTPLTEAFALEGIGNTYTRMGSGEKALEYYNRSLEIRKNLGFKGGVASALTNIGKLFYATGDTVEAAEYLQQALDISREINYSEGIYKSSEVLAVMLDGSGRYKEAIELYKIFYQAKDEVKNENAIRRIRSIELQHKMEQTESERALLAAKNKELESYYHDVTLLSEIGQKIISSLSIEVILDTVYANVNSLMDAAGFGIGLYREKENEILFPVYIEGGVKLVDTRFDASDMNKLGSWCFQNKKEVFINDIHKEITNYVKVIYKPVAGRSVDSLIYLPLTVKDKTLGVITVQSFEKNAYTNYHLDILRNLAVYAAIALENAQIYEGMEETVQERTKEVVSQKEEIERSYENTRLLSEIGQELTSTLNFEKLFNRLHENVNLLMDAAVFGVRVYHAEAQVVEYKFEIENGVHTPSEMVSMADQDNYSVWCISHKKEIFINDNLREYKKYTSQIRVVSGDMPHSLIFYPLMIGERVLGVITVQSFRRQAYTPYHLDILKTLASYTAIALENASLYENLEEKIRARTTEVLKQKEIIEEKNKNITDSIKYAKKIQQALLPNEAEILKALPQSFIYYKPKDIVSGDFYWYTQFGDYAIFAAADCTGHGVPGAFMSAICNDLMNQVIRDEHVSDPALALQQLDSKLRMLLKKSADQGANDGMDIALCSLHMKTQQLQYAGAHRPLLIQRGTEILEFKPDKLSIGGYNVGDKVFTNHRLAMQNGDIIYLFTDGYTDQFGGPKGKKFKYRQLKELFLLIKDKPMKEQRELIASAFKQWRQIQEQVDDILVLGVRI